MSKKPQNQPSVAPAAAPAAEAPKISFAAPKKAFEGPVTYPRDAGAYIRTESGELIPDPSEQRRAPAAPADAEQKEADE